MRDENKCEGCGEPATTVDREGVPLCQGCADDLAAEFEQESGEWAKPEANQTFPTCEAVGECPRPTVDAAPFHHFYNDAMRDAYRMDQIHEHGFGHEDPMSNYGAVMCKTCGRRALVLMNADDFPEI